MEEQTDQTFIKNISIVIAILAVFSVGIFFVAKDIGQHQDSGENSHIAAFAEQRVKPVADVYLEGDTVAVAMPVVVAEEAAAAFNGSLDGAMIYNSVCAACHTTGAAGAPLPGTDAMAQRAEKGLDALVSSAISGLNAMPARGGRSDLSDEQIRAAVEFMLQ